MRKIPGVSEARLCAVLGDLDTIISSADLETAHRAIRLKWRLQGYDPAKRLDDVYPDAISAPVPARPQVALSARED